MLNFIKKSRGFLGINARNLKYITPSISRRARLIIDSKLATKKRLKKAGLPVPETYGIIKSRQELTEFDFANLPKSFTLKPNRGYGGFGVMIVYGKKKGYDDIWVKADRSLVTINDFKNHILSILDGDFSLTNLPDIAFFEERLKILKELKLYSHKGIPDIRLIVYNKVPVMAELRLPTQESRGRANLHLGGIGIGIDIGTGTTTSAIWHDHLVDYTPGTRLLLRGIKIPRWNEILRVAIEAQIAIKTNFIAVDTAIDRERGPVILELNARPGLSIQIANLAPLRERLERVRGLKIKTVKRGIKVAKELFSEESEGEAEELAGKKIIGINEPVEIILNAGAKFSILAKIDTGAYRTAMAKEIAEKLDLIKIIKYKKVRGVLGEEERPIVPLNFFLDQERIETEVFLADRSQMKYDIIIGRKDLKIFLVDPTKNVLMGSKDIK